MIPHRTKRIVAAVLSPDYAFESYYERNNRRAITYRDNNNLGMF